MTLPVPHYLLFAESRRRESVAAAVAAIDVMDTLDAPSTGTAAESVSRRADSATYRCGQWRFVLEAVDGSAALEVADHEAESEVERLELLAVIRGLEALDQPSRVTLVTRSRYVSHGLRFGLSEWRENGWQWERFGQFVPVKNGDLWRRIDHALHFHRVDCRAWRFDAAHESGARRASARTLVRRSPRPAEVSLVARWLRRMRIKLHTQFVKRMSALRQFVARYPQRIFWAAE